MSYEVLILRRAQRELADLPSREYERVKASMFSLSDHPRPRGCLKLTDRPGWRVRVGNYRIIYEIDDHAQTVTVLEVVNRRDAYN